MKHFICISYETFAVYGARYDLIDVPGRNFGSVRDDLIEAIARSRIERSIEGRDTFISAIKETLADLMLNRDGPLHLTVVGYGPFEFGSGLARVATKARGGASGVNLREIVSPLLQDGDRVQFTTDAIAAACAGYWARYTGTEKTRSFTIASLVGGVGIGGALVQKYGRSIGSAHHSEFGHTRIHLLANDPAPISVCGHHKGCLQGICSWAALQARAEYMNIKNLNTLFSDPDHILWDMQARYIAQGCQNFMFTAPPFQIVLGGTMFECAPWLVQRVWQVIQEETGPEFLYPDAQRSDFIVFRPLSRECLVGGLHMGLSGAQDATSETLRRIK